MNNNHKENTVLSNGKIALADSMSVESRERISRLDGILVVLCLKGSCSLEINGQEHVVHNNEIMICTPQTLLKYHHASYDMDFKAVYLSIDHAFKLFPASINRWDMRMFIESNPVFALTEDEVDMFCKYFDLLKARFIKVSDAMRDKVIDTLTLSFIYSFADIMERFTDMPTPEVSSANNLFYEFLKILGEGFPKPRNVAYYAERLNITPKYLSVICKKASKQTASKIIDAYVVKDIEHLLLSTRKSIKEVSVMLEFPNTSFFGRYVKKHLGCTPNEFRKRNI